MQKLFVALIALLLGISVALFVFQALVSPQSRLSFVQRVIDGDTIVLASGERLRLIGIDAPERGEPCFEEAKQALRGLLSGKAVELRFDVERHDRYGRLLAYLFVDGNFVNLALVEKGLALSFPFEPNTSHAAEFAEAEQKAREHSIGCLWRE